MEQTVGQAMLRNICEKERISIYELAKKTNITQSTLNEIKQGRSKNPRINTFIKIADGFGISLSELFNKYL